MDEDSWQKAQAAFHRDFIADRESGMGWGELAEKYHMTKRVAQKLWKKLSAGCHS